MKLWYCKIGEVEELLRTAHGADGTMREAAAEAYLKVTGRVPRFIFSGWGAELEEHERAVVEDREPDPAVTARELHGRLEVVEHQLVLQGDLQSSNGVDLIGAERIRQIVEEGWTAGNDDQHRNAQMVSAALCYALAFTPRSPPGTGVVVRWPWDQSWWKPGDRIRNLAKAGALIAAEIDRLERANG